MEPLSSYKPSESADHNPQQQQDAEQRHGVSYEPLPLDATQLKTSLCWASSLDSQHDATRICCWTQSILIDRWYAAPTEPFDRPGLSNKPAACRCCCRSTGQTDGRTCDRYIAVGCCMFAHEGVQAVVRHVQSGGRYYNNTELQHSSPAAPIHNVLWAVPGHSKRSRVPQRTFLLLHQ